MSIPVNTSVSQALRTLHREGMNRFGAELEWLTSPEEIPEEATETTVMNGYGSRYQALGMWMIRRFADWSSNNYLNLSRKETFAKHALSPSERIAVSNALRESETAYAPGIAAMAELFRIVPLVATREGVEREGWSDIASKTRRFGSSIARDGTDVQSVVRDYLYEDSNRSYSPLDSSKLKLDEETGLTTVTPIEDILVAAKAARDDLFPELNRPGVCVALQAKSPNTDGCSMFDATWDAYGYAAGKYIYPNEDIKSEDIPAQAKPNKRIDVTIARLLLTGVIQQQMILRRLYG